MGSNFSFEEASNLMLDSMSIDAQALLDKLELEYQTDCDEFASRWKLLFYEQSHWRTGLDSSRYEKNVKWCIEHDSESIAWTLLFPLVNLNIEEQSKQRIADAWQIRTSSSNSSALAVTNSISFLDKFDSRYVDEQIRILARKSSSDIDAAKVFGEWICSRISTGRDIAALSAAEVLSVITRALADSHDEISRVKIIPCSGIAAVYAEDWPVAEKLSSEVVDKFAQWGAAGAWFTYLGHLAHGLSMIGLGKTGEANIDIQAIARIDEVINPVVRSGPTGQLARALWSHGYQSDVRDFVAQIPRQWTSIHASVLHNWNAGIESGRLTLMGHENLI